MIREYRRGIERTFDNRLLQSTGARLLIDVEAPIGSEPTHGVLDTQPKLSSAVSVTRSREGRPPRDVRGSHKLPSCNNRSPVQYPRRPVRNPQAPERASDRDQASNSSSNSGAMATTSNQRLPSSAEATSPQGRQRSLLEIQLTATSPPADPGPPEVSGYWWILECTVCNKEIEHFRDYREASRAQLSPTMIDCHQIPSNYSRTLRLLNAIGFHNYRLVYRACDKPCPLSQSSRSPHSHWPRILVMALLMQLHDLIVALGVVLVIINASQSLPGNSFSPGSSDLGSDHVTALDSTWRWTVRLGTVPALLAVWLRFNIRALTLNTADSERLLNGLKVKAFVTDLWSTEPSFTAKLF